MATLTRRGAGTPVTSGTTWAATTSAVDGTPPANPATYATWTNNAAGAVGYIEVTGYDFSAIAAGSTLNTVTVSLRHLVSSAARFTTITFQAYAGATPLGSAVSGTLPTSATTVSGTFPVTLAQLQAGTFKVRATATRAGGTTSSVWSVDQLDVVADFTPPYFGFVDLFPGPGYAAGWTTIGASAALVGGRSRHLLTTAYDGEILAAGPYSFAGRQLLAEVEVPAAGGATRNAWLWVRDVGGGAAQAHFELVGPDLRFYQGDFSLANFTSITYDPVAHRWWRITEVAGALYWDTSPDATTWTNRRTVAAHGYTVGAGMGMSLGAGFDADPGGGPHYAYFDNLNSPIATPLGGKPKVWTGSAWVEKPCKVWSGSAWVEKPVKVWSGSAWVLA